RVLRAVGAHRPRRRAATDRQRRIPGVSEPEGRVAAAAAPDTGQPARSADPAVPVPSSAAEVIQASPDAVGIVDADLTVVAWNAAAERLYGIPAAEAIGRSLRDSLRVEMPGHPDVIGQLVRASPHRHSLLHRQ